MAFEELNRWPLKLAQTLGYKVGFDAEKQQAHCVLDMSDLHTNPQGTFHGGVTAIMLDTASGLTANLSENPEATLPALTLSLNINYLAAATSGQLRAIGRITGGGRKIKYVECELRDDKNTLIATSSGVFKIQLPRPTEGSA